MITRTCACFGAMMIAATDAQAISVAFVSDFQTELGCVADFTPDCPAAQFSRSSQDDIWRNSSTIPAGDWQYKVTEDAFAETYPIGRNLSLSTANDSPVRFYYDDISHYVADSINRYIPTLAGSFQSEVGCGSDFNASCLRSWLTDQDGDGIYSFSAFLPIGSYSTVVALNESFDETYGQGGVMGGGNIAFTVKDPTRQTRFLWDGETKILTVNPVPLPASLPLLAAGLGVIAVLRRKTGR